MNNNQSSTSPKNTSSVDVSVIIVNYNTLHVLLPCIDSVVSMTKDVSYEIIVIDNGSSDGSVEVLEKHPHLVFVPTGENLGFGKANNKGLEHARGRYIFFLNSDTILKNNAIKIFYDFAEQYNGRLGALGCILTDREGNNIHSYGNFPRMRDDFNKYIFIPVLKGLHIYRQPIATYPDKWMTVDYVTGADLFVNRAVINRCGAFNPAFFMYYEESEMQYRFTQEGYENIILHGPQIVHLEGEGAKDGVSSKFLRNTLRQQKSEYIYYKLTEPRWKYYLFRIIHPILRQTVWLNPHVTFADKWKYLKQLFVSINI